VEQKLDCLVSEGISEPVKFAGWALPIVLKADGHSVKICDDFTPTDQRFFVRVAGRKAFTKLDLSQAYQQVPLAEESCKHVVINTHCIKSLAIPHLVFFPHQECFNA